MDVIQRVLFCRWFGVLAGLAAGTVAWAAETEGGVTPLEEIQVIGSHIPMVDASGLAPVLTMDREAIEASGSMYLGDVLQRLAVDSAGTFNDRNPLSSALGGSGISLRSLGANSVLVLINGRRAATYGFAQDGDDGSLVSFVDLNSIPVAAVQRVEILKDGASAMYGSEAMAGVVNIVLRDRFDGAELQVRGGGSEHGGAGEKALSGIWGRAWERGNIELIASYAERDSLDWEDRDVSASIDKDGQPGDLRDVAATNFANYDWLANYGADCESRDPGQFEFLPDEDICLYNPNADIVQPRAERLGGTLIGNLALSGTLSLHAELSALASDVEGRQEPVDLNGVTFPAGNPWNPFGEDVSAFYQFTETGDRVNRLDSDTWRGVLELNGQRGEWLWQAGALYHRNELHERSDGQVNPAALDAALNGVDLDGDGTLSRGEYLNLYSPATAPSSARLVDSLLASTVRKATSELSNVFAKLSGPLVHLPAGDLVMAFGAELGQESLNDRSDPLSLGAHLANLTPIDLYMGFVIPEPFEVVRATSADYVDVWEMPGFVVVAPSGPPSATGKRTLGAVYSEAQVPLGSRVRVQGALRYDAYEDLDGQLAPRIAVRYEPFANRDAALRASWGRGSRAPSLTELNVGESARVLASWDPTRCPVEGMVDPEVAGCVGKNFVSILQGNRDLEAETSDSVSVGVDLHPSDDTAVAVDCWNTQIDDRILSLGPANILRYEQILGPGFVERREPDGIYGVKVGFIDRVNDRYVNAADQKVSGCDAEIKGTLDTRRYGSYGAQLIASHLRSNELRALDSLPWQQLDGSPGYPENRANLNLSWRGGAWRAHLQGRYTGGFAQDWGPGSVDDHVEWDLQLGYAGLRGYELTLGVDNVLDEEPPVATNPAGYPLQFYDMRGRFAYLQARVSLEALRQGGAE